jgi:hypothetical protein
VESRHQRRVIEGVVLGDQFIRSHASMVIVPHVGALLSTESQSLSHSIVLPISGFDSRLWRLQSLLMLGQMMVVWR